jgi:hypothetical protein
VQWTPRAGGATPFPLLGRVIALVTRPRLATALVLALLLWPSGCTGQAAGPAAATAKPRAGSAASCTTVTSDGTSLSLRLPAGWTKATDMESPSSSQLAHLAADLQLGRAADSTFTTLVSVYTSTHKGQVSAALFSADVAGVLQTQHDRLGRDLLRKPQLVARRTTVAGRPAWNGSFVDAHPNRAVRSSYHWWAFSADRVVFTVVLTEAQSGPSAATTVSAGISEKPCAS